MLDDIQSMRRTVVSGSSTDLLNSVNRLRTRPEDAARILTVLSHDPSAEVRSWVPAGARDLLGLGAVPLLREMLHGDPHPDVREAALVELLRLEPTSITEVLPTLTRMLSSDDYWEPVTAMWLAASANLSVLAPDIRRIADAPHQPWHSRHAAVVLLLLNGHTHTILDRLRSHDHDFTAPLARGAAQIGSPEARSALEYCATHAPDESCRRDCQRAIELLGDAPSLNDSR